uniref:Uncharacterized protein n=1 Tax=Kwoniella dejecticola CBS 10117 TaxID=1296121 RepID=A0A1A6AG59_9TREE|nr:uncharacterized protein I303_00866 [Kwoniella dejecticola CBS 10117]OBR89044.1 hypothetical protein I303_00866 [Kwoniella dejecticola CBS 10117]
MCCKNRKQRLQPRALALKEALDRQGYTITPADGMGLVDESREAVPLSGTGTRNNPKTGQKLSLAIDPPSYDQVQKYTSPIDPTPRTEEIYHVRVDDQTVSINPGREYGFMHHSDSNASLVRVPVSEARPDAKCTDPSGHSPKTVYGAVGIIAGIVFFPWGLFW